MSFVMYYRRIPEALLQQFIETGAEDAAWAYMRQDRRDFPYSIQHFHFHDPYILHGLLDPTRSPESVFWHVTEGATLLRLVGDQDPTQLYLGRVYYLTPAEVQRIVVAMVMLDLDLLVTHLRHELKMPGATAPDILAHPGADWRLQLFLVTLAFFHIAAEHRDGILRLYMD